MDHPSSSPLDTLRQLKEMLDAGALTPAEFEALKQRLLFQEPAPTPPAPPAPLATPSVELPPVVPAVPVVPLAPPANDVFPAPLPAETEPDEPAFVPPAVRRAHEADLPPAPVPVPEPSYVADEFPEAAAPAARSPLALILSIGGLLALLGLVLYLSLNRRPSERISSTSLTPADTLAAPIETGPQAEQMTTPAAVPETIRVAPAHPAAPAPVRPAPSVRDSAAAPTASPGADSAASQ